MNWKRLLSSKHPWFVALATLAGRRSTEEPPHGLCRSNNSWRLCTKMQGRLPGKISPKFTRKLMWKTDVENETSSPFFETHRGGICISVTADHYPNLMVFSWEACRAYVVAFALFWRRVPGWRIYRREAYRCDASQKEFFVDKLGHKWTTQNYHMILRPEDLLLSTRKQ